MQQQKNMKKILHLKISKFDIFNKNDKSKVITLKGTIHKKQQKSNETNS